VGRGTYKRYNVSLRVTSLLSTAITIRRCAACYCYISNQRKRETCWYSKETQGYGSVMKRSQVFRYMMGVGHLKKAEQRLKTWDGKVMARVLWTVRASYSSIFWQNNESST